jgi:catechol 2,3-dioxygenase-like lactoylglutathione lyase family enzyme
MACPGGMRETAGMDTFRFDHIHLRSPDPEAAAAIWASAFGAEVKSRVMAGPWLRLVLDLAGVTLFLEQVPPETHAPPAPPFLGVEHIGLAVSDLDAAIADLAGKGVKLVSGPSSPRPGVRIAFFAMPDDVRVELIERRG